MDNRPLLVKFREANRLKKKKSENPPKPEKMDWRKLDALREELKFKLKSNGLTLIEFHQKYLRKVNISKESFYGMLNTGGTNLSPEVFKIIKRYLRKQDGQKVARISPDDLKILTQNLSRKLRSEKADHIWFHQRFLSGTGIDYENFMIMRRPSGKKITPQVKEIIESYVNGPPTGY